MAEQEQFLSQEEVYQGKIFSVEKRQVTLADGTQAQRDIVHHGLAVGILPLVDADHAILVRQWRAAANDFVYEIPAGKVDSRDQGTNLNPSRSAALRELNEEIRVHPQSLVEFASGYEAVGFTDAQIALYLATGLQTLTDSQRLPQDQGESLDILTVSYADVTSWYQQGLLNDQKTITAYFYWTNWRMTNGK